MSSPHGYELEKDSPLVVRVVSAQGPCASLHDPELRGHLRPCLSIYVKEDLTVVCVTFLVEFNANGIGGGRLVLIRCCLKLPRT